MRRLKKHRYKVLASAPIIFVLLLNQSNVGTTTVNSVALTSMHTSFIEVGESLDFAIDARSLIPVNAVGASLKFPENTLAVDSVSIADSVVDLWIEKPSYDNGRGTAKLSGGITGENGFIGDGHLATYRFTALRPGKASITVSDAVLLARDGKGTNVLEATENMTFVIREKGAPSPDLNKDGQLALSDAAVLYIATFRPYDKRFDINNDGKVSFADVTALMALIT